MLIVTLIVSLFVGGVSGYFIGDGLAPKSDYMECIKTVREGKGGVNINDCDGFAREKTVKGMLENYKLCYETFKLADKPEQLNCDKEVLERFNFVNERKRE